jgi:hypothetical protein
MKQVKAAALPILTNRNINPAANSKFWLPMEGFWYFTKHPSLWKIVLLPICCAMLLDLIGVILLFALALVPQANLLLAVEGMPEAVAWLIAVALTAIECLLLVIVTATIVFGAFGSKLFAKTMELEGVPLNDDVPCREECWGDFWMGFFRFALFICLLPLHLIPCVGTILFCYLNGCEQRETTRLGTFPLIFLPQFSLVGTIIKASLSVCDGHGRLNTTMSPRTRPITPTLALVQCFST